MFTFDLVYSLSLDAFLSFNIDHTVSQISDLALLKCSNMNISRRHYTALEKVLAVDTQLGYTHSFHWVWPDLHTHSSRLALSGSICSVLVQTVLQWTSLDIILGMFFWLFLSPSFFPSSLNPFLLCFLSLPLRFLFLSPPPSCLFFFKQFLLHLRRFLCSLVWPSTQRLLSIGITGCLAAFCEVLQGKGLEKLLKGMGTTVPSVPQPVCCQLAHLPLQVVVFVLCKGACLWRAADSSAPDMAGPLLTTLTGHQ